MALHGDIEEYLRRTEILIEALPFIQEFRGSTFVIKYGGSAMEDDEVVERLLRDVVFLEAVGINPVLVHGGGKAITRRLAAGGVESRFVGGLRVTDAAAIRIVAEILDEVVNPRIVETIRRFGGRAEGYSGCDVFRSRRIGELADTDGAMVDIGFVGEVSGVHIREIRRDIRNEVVSVVSPLSLEDGTDEVLNVNADTAAAALAARLKATKMIYLSDVPGILRRPDDEGSLIPTVDRAAIRELIGGGVINGGMLPKVRSAVGVIEAGVGKVHFIDGRIPHGLLLEVFTQAGVGTEILA